jgi:predicted dienelactone hydrolase
MARREHLQPYLRKRPDRIEFDDNEIEAASHWYGGMDLLYAVASTGSLSRGTNRPRNEDGSAMTDEEWMNDLAAELVVLATQCAQDARVQRRETRSTRDRQELLDDEQGLYSIAYKARRYLEQ